MELSHFNSFFEILIGLNLGYAVFDYYRKELTTRVFKTNKLSDNLEILKSRLQVHKTSAADDQEFKQALEKISNPLSIEEEKIRIEEGQERLFLEILKPISFLLSLHCISFLIFAGFQATMDGLDFFNNYFFTLSSLTGVFTYLIFCGSYSKRVYGHKLKITSVQILVIFPTLLLIAYYCTARHFFSVSSLEHFLIIIMSPIIIYWIAIGNRVLKHEEYCDRSSGEKLKSFYKLSLFNFKPLVRCLISLVVASIPIGLYLFYPDFYVIKYLVILVTPLFLYLFLAFRVYSDKKKYGKKYEELSKLQSDILDTLLKGYQKIPDNSESSK